MAKHRPTAQYQPNQFPVQRQIPTRRKTTESDPPVNAYTCKSYDDYDTDSCSDEEDDESEGYLQDTIKTKQNISPYSSIYRTDSGLILRNEFPQSGTSTPGLTEVARQMSKVSDEMSTLCSNVSDLTSGIKNMLCEIDNDALQRSSCFTCGSLHHMAKECPSRLSRDPQERAVRQSAKSQRDEEVGPILAPVKHGQKIRQTKIRNVIQSQQLVTKGQQNKRIAVSPQLKTKGKQNKRIVQQNGKQSPQLRANVIQRKQQNVKPSPQLESVQSETKSHQIKEMQKQGDRQYQLSGNVQNEHQPDNSKYQPQLVDSSCQDSSVATSQVMQYPQPENVKNEHRPDNNKNQPQLVDSSCQDNFVSTS